MNDCNGVPLVIGDFAFRTVDKNTLFAVEITGIRKTNLGLKASIRYESGVDSDFLYSSSELRKAEPEELI